MRKAVPVYFALLLMIFGGVIDFSLTAQEIIPEEEAEVKTAGWLNVGTVVHLVDIGHYYREAAGGVFDNFGPALELRTLLSADDTLWIGTEGGLFAWSTAADTVFKVTGPVFESIRVLARDDSGLLWVGGDLGVSIRGDEGWIHYTADEHPFFDKITDFQVVDDRIWITSYGQGCGYLSGDSLTIITRADSLLDDRVLSVVEENDNVIWFGTASGVCRADSFRWQSLRYGQGIPIGAVEDVIIDEEGNLFLAVANQGITRYNFGRVRNYGPRQGLPGRDIGAFSLDPAGRVWAAGRSGLTVYDGSGWTPFRLPQTFMGRYHFLSIHHNVDGNLFLGTDEGKLLIVSPDSLKVVSLPQRFPEGYIPLIRRYDDALWFLSRKAVYRLGENLTPLVLPGSGYEGTLTDLAVDGSGGLWLTTRFGILHLEDRSWEVFDRRHKLPTEYFTSVSVQENGDLWFGTFQDGLLRYTGDRWTHYAEKNGLVSNRITDTLVDGAGVLWVLFADGRVARFVSGIWEVLEMPGGDRYAGEGRVEPDSLRQLDHGIRFLTGKNSGPGRGRISSGYCLGRDALGFCLIGRPDGIFRLSATGWQVIEPPPGRRIEPSAVTGLSGGELWLGTGGDGIYIKRGGRWIHRGAAQGLADNHVLSIVEDGSGQVWIGTRSGGITRFKFSQ
ncbi:MAG: hypothetical protein JXB45_10005 [Candidatus Krumholzibacteriota bacterium]|nr:hypothetical protein [Candidatus Krumholzibacteriota bacterium]